MGLLDFLQSNDPTERSSLIDFLRNNALNQQMPAGLPSDTANYGGTPGPMSMAGPPAPAPVPAMPPPVIQATPPAPAPMAMPPVAAPAPVAPPPAPAPASPGIGDRLALGAKGFLGNMGAGPLGAVLGGVGAAISGQPTDPGTIAAQKDATLQTANEKFLLSKGADPAAVQAAKGSPEAMTSLLKQYTAAPTSIGNGYIIKNGVVTRAYEPDDKTPTSVAEYKFYKDNLAKGQIAMPYQQWVTAKDGGGLSLTPIYGKDAAGNTVLLQPGKDGVAVQSKLPDGVTLNGVDSETLASDAKRLNEGDDTILKKYSNKGQGRVDLLRLNNEANRQRQEAGQDPIDLTQNRVALQGDIARERAAGNMEGRMAPAAVEAQGAFKIAREASDALNRTNFVPFNKILQAGQTAFSNPELKAAATAYNTAVMTYSKAITPTGVGTVTAQEHARQILETADGPQATAAAFDQLSREVDMAHQSPALARQYFADARKAKMAGLPPPPMPQYQNGAPPAAAAPAAAPPLPQPGDMQGGYRFKGGNPADQANWEPAT